VVTHQISPVKVYYYFLLYYVVVELAGIGVSHSLISFNSLIYNFFFLGLAVRTFLNPPLLHSLQFIASFLQFYLALLITLSKFISSHIYTPSHWTEKK